MTRQLYTPRTSRIINGSLPILESYGYVEQDILDVISTCHHDESMVLERIGELALEGANGRQWVNISSNKAAMKKKPGQRGLQYHSSERSERGNSKFRPGQGLNRDGNSRKQNGHPDEPRPETSHYKRHDEKLAPRQAKVEQSKETRAPEALAVESDESTPNVLASTKDVTAILNTDSGKSDKPLKGRSAFVNVVKMTIEKERTPTPSTVSSPQRLEKAKRTTAETTSTESRSGETTAQSIPSNKNSPVSSKEKSEAKTSQVTDDTSTRIEPAALSEKSSKVSQESKAVKFPPPPRAPVTIMARPQDRTATRGSTGADKVSNGSQHESQAMTNKNNIAQSYSRNLVQNVHVPQMAVPMNAWRFGTLNPGYYAATSGYPPHEEWHGQEQQLFSQTAKQDVKPESSKVPGNSSGLATNGNLHFRGAVNRDMHDNMMPPSYIPPPCHPATLDQYDQLLPPPSFSHMYPDGRATYGYYTSGGFAAAGTPGMPYVASHHNPVYVQDSMQHYRSHVDPLSPAYAAYPMKSTDDDVTLSSMKPAENHNAPHHLQWAENNLERFGMMEGLEAVHPYAFDRQANPTPPAYRNVYHPYRPQYAPQ